MPTRYSGTEREERVLNTWIKMNRALGVLSSRLERVTQDHELTHGQFGILEILHHLGPLSQKELGLKHFSTEGNICQIVGNLEKRGLIVRERNEEDRRSMTVSLTGDGRALIQRVFPAYLQVLAEGMAVLEDTDMDQLARIARRLGLAVSGKSADCEEGSGNSTARVLQ